MRTDTATAAQAASQAAEVDSRRERAAITRRLAAQALQAAQRSGGSDATGLRGPDAVRLRLASRSVAGEALARSDRLGGALDRVEQTMGRLRAAVRDLEGRAAASPEGAAAAQREIDSIVAGLERVASESRELGATVLAGGSAGSGDFGVLKLSPALDSLRVTRADVKPGERLDVQLLVHSAAQRAGLFLSFGGQTIDLASVSERFTIEIGGTDGVRAFSFASGSTVSAIAESFKVLGSDIGVSASVAADGTGVLLHSRNVGTSESVSVQVIDDGGLRDQTVHSAGTFEFHPNGFVGVYSVRHVNEHVTGLHRLLSMSAAESRETAIIDAGRDISVSVQFGEERRLLQSSGLTFWLAEAAFEFVASFKQNADYDPTTVERPDIGAYFDAFTIVGLDPPPPPPDDSTIVTREEERQRERESATNEEDDPPTPTADEADRIAEAFRQASLDFGLLQPLNDAQRLVGQARRAQVRSLGTLAARSLASARDAQQASFAIREAAQDKRMEAIAQTGALDGQRALELLRR